MKKFFAIMLALVMCLSLFTACGDKGETTGTQTTVDETAALEKAAEYVKSMYLKDTGSITIDFTLTKVVSTVDGKYTVTWTVDNTDMVTIVDGENAVTVDIENYPAEEYSFTMTGTVTSTSGKTATVTLKYTVPQAAGASTTIADGTYVIATGNLSFAALAESYSYGYLYPNEVTVADGTVTGFVAADIVTITNVDGGITIQDCYGRYVYMKGDYSSYNVDTTMPEEGHIWTVLATEGGYLLVNATNGKTVAYSQSYASWGAYAEDKLSDDHLTVVTITPADPANAGESGPEYGAEYADQEVSIETALDIAANIGGAGTTYKVYIKGTVTEIASDVYGNLYITDGTNTIYVYGVYDADGTNRYDAMANAPQVGDEVTLYGILMTYGETCQMKNAWVVGAEGGETPEPTPDPDPEPTPDPEPNPDPDPVAAPTAGVAYYLFVNHETVGKGLYFTGTTANRDYYFSTSESVDDAMVVYLEETTGGFLLYFTADGVKTYIDIYLSGTYINLRMTDAPTAVYTWNSEYGTLVATLEDGTTTAYIGAYGTYETMSASSTSYLGNAGSFWTQLIPAN